MANPKGIPISSITETTPKTELIKKRVIRMWLRKSDKNPTVVQGVELILADQNGDTIQATIKKSLVKIFLEVLNEGDTYKIRKFNTSSNRLGYDMATFHLCKIWFEYSTRVIPVLIPDIPNFVLTFYTFKDFAMGAMPDKLYVVFGEYVEQMTKIEEAFKNKNKPTLVLMYIKRSVYNGEVSISTTWGASQILVNPDMFEVLQFNQSFLPAEVEQSLFGVSENAAHHPPILASANIKSLDEIQTLTQAGSYVTMATFVELATSGIFTLVPPPDFRPLIEKEFIVKIRVTKEFNIEQKSTSYGVICLSDDPTTISKWKNIHAASKEKSMSTIFF
ncbi:uncharacterized protein LOC141628178 [Silene latifolia]|uniref:uncharacterized protein LOC141628178 n=1 Tax=Silene latifolia TaxID=37657 RepID=UPI003D77065F